jgi:hypothetical protein
MLFIRNPYLLQSNKVLIIVITTTTKIGTKGFSNLIHIISSAKPSRSSTHAINTFLFAWISISNPLERHPFSGLYLSAGELLRIP